MVHESFLGTKVLDKGGWRARLPGSRAACGTKGGGRRSLLPRSPERAGANYPDSIEPTRWPRGHNAFICPTEPIRQHESFSSSAQQKKCVGRSTSIRLGMKVLLLFAV